MDRRCIHMNKHLQYPNEIHLDNLGHSQMVLDGK